MTQRKNNAHTNNSFRIPGTRHTRTSCFNLPHHIWEGRYTGQIQKWCLERDTDGSDQNTHSFYSDGHSIIFSDCTQGYLCFLHFNVHSVKQNCCQAFVRISTIKFAQTSKTWTKQGQVWVQLLDSPFVQLRAERKRGGRREEQTRLRPQEQASKFQVCWMSMHDNVQKHRSRSVVSHNFPFHL